MMKHLTILVALTIAHVAAAQSAYRAVVTSPSGAPVADAVVFLVPATPHAAKPPTEPVVIAQDGQEYTPYVTAVLVGTTVEFPNRDLVQHHIYSVSPAKRFEKPLYKSGSSESVVFDKPGVVTLGCNIHDWMSAYVLVLETPHFARTDKQGQAVISGLPPGNYRAEVWHPRLKKTVAREITIAGEAKEDAFGVELRTERRIRRAPSGEGGAY